MDMIERLERATHLDDIPATLVEGLEPVRGGWIAQRTSEYVVDVTRMLFNWRIHVSLAEEYGTAYQHGYCYFGNDPDTFVIALSAAKQWADPLHSDPIGFNKKAF